MDKLVFEAEEAIDIIYGDHDDFRVVEESITNQGRWDTYYRVIVEQKSTGNYYKVGYSRGSTEYQDFGAFSDEDEVEFIRVFPVDTIVTIYKTAKEIEEAD